MVYRVYVEKKTGLDLEAKSLKSDIKSLLQIKGVEKVRLFHRYDAEGLSEELFNKSLMTVFAEPQLDDIFTEEAFAAKMTQKAKKLGLQHSTFANATGIPDPNHLMSAKDLALLSQHIINDFPEYYPIYSQKEFTYNGIKQGNRNPLLYSLQGADGLKTGHTSQSGYGLTASVKSPDGRRLILVINGLSSMNERASEARNLMNYGLSHFENMTVLNTEKPVTSIPVWMGIKEEITAHPAENLIQTRPLGEETKITSVVEYQTPLAAPIQKGQKVGTITTTLPDGNIHETDLVSGESVEKLGFFARIKKRLLGG